MSSSVWLAKIKDISVLSPLSRKTARMTCSIGVMPVPPAIIPIFFALRISNPPPWDLSLLMANVPLPLYSYLPFGPEKSRVSPIFSECMCCDTFPPSGKRSLGK